MLNPMKRKLAICTRYSRQGASSRLRYYLYAPALKAAGFETEFHPFFGGRYLRNLYSGGGKSRLLAGAALAKRLAFAPLLPERLLIEYELLPELSYSVESLLLGRRRYVLNFDDNVWEKYAARPRLAGKYDALCRHAAGVIAANDFLLERIRPLNANTIKIPTVVDQQEYVPTTEKFPRFTVVWIGTPVTYAFLEQQAETLRAMARAVEFELLVVAGRQLEARAIPGVPMRFVDWSTETEAELLARSHVGIMPLPEEDPFARGKSAFKLIQYRAAGIPAIASPVGENRTMIVPGETGFLAHTPEEWVSALRTLHDDEGARLRMGRRARELAAECSLQKYAPVLTAFLEKTLG